MHEESGFLAALGGWWAEHQIVLHAAGLSMLISVFRVIYGGGKARQIALESVLCGLATVALVPLLELLGLPQSMASFFGGCVGFMGVDKLREMAINFGQHHSGRKR